MKPRIGTVTWTDVEIEQLTALWNYTALPATKIAARMGKTKGAVIGKANRLNLPARR